MIPADKQTERLRLDELLIARGLYTSRSRARDAIERGTVTVDGATAAKAGQSVATHSDIAVDDPARDYVSRAALKLVAGLEHFRIDAEGATALDVGASTGGFTQVMLQRGARRVIAIDVGHGQMDSGLRADPRVTCIEGLNARALTLEHLGGMRPEIVVCDVSFISLTLALPPALDLARAGAKAVLLVKPQFEAGREAIGKGGLLRNPDDAPVVAERLRAWLDQLPGWQALGLAPSPIEGGDGNREFLLAGVKDR
jgi:23S rRNA (cytidine1920-2'-O)/16S rRNA (cytidine1409-2'-O)-methyltransferase